LSVNQLKSISSYQCKEFAVFESEGWALASYRVKVQWQQMWVDLGSKIRVSSMHVMGSYKRASFLRV